MHKTYQAVIFDMDGLIVDTENFITTPITRHSTNWGLTYRAKAMCAVLDIPWKTIAQTPSNTTTCRSAPKTSTKRG